MNIFNYLVSILCIHGIIIEAHKRRIITDNLLFTRCQLICPLKSQQHQQHDIIDRTCDIPKCMEKSANMTKIGRCPSQPKLDFEKLCIDLCDDHDYSCPDIQKCCMHSCGRSCQVPDGLDDNQQLPPMPENMKITETDCRYVDISWDILTRTIPNNAILYVLEYRDHIGKFFAEHKLSDWNLLSFQHRYDSPVIVNKTTIGLRTVGQVKLNPGRWYQFRVASVNKYGTKGYSNISTKFQLKYRLNPPKSPKIIQTTKYLTNNTSFNLLVSWQSPRSDLPVSKYRISWSLFLHNKLENHSLYMEHVFVMEPQHHYEIKNLLPNASYFIQLQAIATFGRRRLISEKRSKIINTTLDKDFMTYDEQNFSINNRIQNNNFTLKGFIQKKHLQKLNGLNINFLADELHGFIVRIVWKRHAGEVLLELCHAQNSCFKHKNANNFRKLFSIKLKKNVYNFTNLEFGTNYTIRLKQTGKVPSMARQVVIKHFRTPTCKQLKKSYPNLLC